MQMKINRWDLTPYTPRQCLHLSRDLVYRPDISMAPLHLFHSQLGSDAHPFC